MFNKYLSHVVAAAALMLSLSAVVARAQSVQISGKITLRQADGTTAPAQNAVIDLYRTDITGKYETKTNNKGMYVHAGIPFAGTYTIAVSAPGARPTFSTGVKVSQQPTNDFTLDPGDGTRLTLAQIKAAGTGGAPVGAAPPASESKEDKAKREAMERERAEIEAKNKRVTEGNEIVRRTFNAGNDALNAKPPRYDEAITQYREGLSARADEPALLTNLSEALRRRGVDVYNVAIKNPDAEAKTKGLEAARKDWSDAATASQKALEIIKMQTAATDLAAQTNQSQNRLAAITTRALAMKFVATKVDQSQAPAAQVAYQEYIEAETDPVKKAKLQADAAQMLLDAGASDQAAQEAQKLLTADPDSIDANRIMGLALFQSGDKAKFQEAANYLQRFVDKAPDTDPLKQSAREALEYLKTAENVKPTKTQPARTTGRRRG